METRFARIALALAVGFAVVLAAPRVLSLFKSAGTCPCTAESLKPVQAYSGTGEGSASEGFGRPGSLRALAKARALSVNIGRLDGSLKREQLRTRLEKALTKAGFEVRPEGTIDVPVMKVDAVFLSTWSQFARVDLAVEVAPDPFSDPVWCARRVYTDRIWGLVNGAIDSELSAWVHVLKEDTL
jgi:hypothetical protein